jgi:guanylate kinase
MSDQLLEHAVVYGEYKGIPRQQVGAALSKGGLLWLWLRVWYI